MVSVASDTIEPMVRELCATSDRLLKDYTDVGEDSERLGEASEALRNPQYEVVVCGEVKKGKSSFINALVGRDILPTGVRETTSQVFRISNGKKVSCSLVFDDGHEEKISLNELEKYGSQTMAELEGQPLFRGRVLKWIDIKTPCAFLPEGVHLVDTPGLGALYSAHSEITNRYITEADAVIFIMDSGAPLTQPEKRFLDKCYSITPNILFVLTKIDARGEDEWREVQKRNQDLLNREFKREGRANISVFPVSSKHLAEAARQDDEKEKQYLLEDSMFDDVRKALDLLMFRATGWFRCAWLATEASRYARTSHEALKEQKSVLASESAEESSRLRSRKAEVRASFQSQWGANGTMRSEYMAEIERTLQGVRTQAQLIGSTGSDIQRDIMREIQNLGSRESVDHYAASLPVRVQEGVSAAWQELVLAAQKRISQASKAFPMVPEDEEPFRVDLPVVSVKQPSVWDRVKSTNIDGMVGGSLAAVVAGFFLTGGLATAAVVIGGLVGAFKGYERITNQQLEGAKNELRHHAVNLLGKCRNTLISPDIVQGNTRSRVDHFVDTTQGKIKGAMEKEYNLQKTRMEEQGRKLDEQSALDGERRRTALERINARLKDIVAIEGELKSALGQLKTMQGELDKAEAALGSPA